MDVVVFRDQHRPRFGMEDGARGFQEVKWFGGDGIPQLFDVVGVITANAGDGARSTDAEKAGGHGCGVGRQGRL